MVGGRRKNKENGKSVTTGQNGGPDCRVEKIGEEAALG